MASYSLSCGSCLIHACVHGSVYNTGSMHGRKRYIDNPTGKIIARLPCCHCNIDTIVNTQHMNDRQNPPTVRDIEKESNDKAAFAGSFSNYKRLTQVFSKYVNTSCIVCNGHIRTLLGDFFHKICAPAENKGLAFSQHTSSMSLESSKLDWQFLHLQSS